MLYLMQGTLECLPATDVQLIPMAKEKEPGKDEVAKVLALIGRRGGFARAKALSSAQRKQSAQKAAKARWGTKPPKKEKES
jgi:hypothetical protein